MGAYFGMAFQPSEFVKVSFLIYAAAWLGREKFARNQKFETGLLPFLFPLGVVLFLLIAQPNTGTTMVIAGTAFLIFFRWSAVHLVCRLRRGGSRLGCGACETHSVSSGEVHDFSSSGVGSARNRISHQPGISCNRFRRIVRFGIRAQSTKVPVSSGSFRRFYFAVMAEELGFIAVIFFLIVLSALVLRCFRIAKNAPDRFGSFLAGGVGGWIAIQSILNIASMLGLLPITGVTLPFISYGSSAFIALCVGCGMVVSVSRQSQ